MANELEYKIELKHNGKRITPTSNRRRVSPASLKGGGQRQTIGTSEEVVVLPEVTSMGFAWFKNRDATNYVQVGKTADYFVRIPPGEECGLWLEPGIVLYAKANTASVDLEFWIGDR